MLDLKTKLLIRLTFFSKYFAPEFSQHCGHVKVKPGHNCARLLNPDCEEPAKEVNHLKKVADFAKKKRHLDLPFVFMLKG